MILSAEALLSAVDEERVLDRFIKWPNLVTAIASMIAVFLMTSWYFRDQSWEIKILQNNIVRIDNELTTVKTAQAVQGEGQQKIREEVVRIREGVDILLKRNASP